ncbi:beta-carotene 15,15'-monooxygenase [Actinomyces qiguomingii]|uniref:beta-carotene 15,15'-monooxygenase n=1 Tax=Actinomyces qiguomingii TaxID=2057800 RepID=UPI000FFEEEC1|nr:beta-carotene 15,15'-monooxygenase [Actinomyces qiguomingii]
MNVTTLARRRSQGPPSVLPRIFGGPQEPGSAGRTRWAIEALLLSMSPAILLSTAYPLAMSRMTGHAVGGVPVSLLIVSVAVAVPWLSQITCNPAYRLLGEAVQEGADAVATRFAHYWPIMLGASVAPVMIVSALVAMTTGWGAGTMAAHFVLTMENMVFVESLIVADVTRRRRYWALGWTAYAAAVLIAPAMWYLPPLLGTLVQAAPLGRALRGVLRPWPVRLGPYLRDMVRGLVLGGVLWADKLLLFLTLGGDWDIPLAYLCLQPAVLAYSFYFAVTSPRVNAAVRRFHADLTEVPISDIHVRGQRLRRLLAQVMTDTVLVAVVAGFFALVIGLIFVPGKILAVAVVVLGSILTALLTLLAYEIDHAGQRMLPMLLSGVHLLGAIAAFTMVGGLLPSFAVIALLDVVLLILAAAAYRRAWAAPEYSFFWRKALAW